MANKTDNKTVYVTIDGHGGHTVIDKTSPLKRLHYFDGKFLRAPDMQLEQRALLNQVRLSNQAGGAGVVYGYDCALGVGDSLDISAGLAFDPQGRALYMPHSISVAIEELIEKSRSARQIMREAVKSGESVKKYFGECESYADPSRPDRVIEQDNLYLIVANYAEAYCGEEDVYGKLCEEACVTSSQRPYIIEGVEIRLIPFNLYVALKQSTSVSLTDKHLRSRVASAYFEQERRKIQSHISGSGLVTDIWCHGASILGGDGVALGVLARSGMTTLYLDMWTVRRERMESPPRHYWYGRMAMRAWNIYLAQILQFQCQLSHCFRKKREPGGNGDPCSEEKAKIAVLERRLEQMKKEFLQSAKKLERLEFSENNEIREAGFNNPETHVLAEVAPAGIEERFLKRAIDVKDSVRFAIPQRMLIDCGIVELPSAGYLPVKNHSSITINEQVRRMMGEGVDLRFCVVRADYIPHALEEAQHMERICLLEGLDDPTNKPKVDVLVPDGIIKEYQPEVKGVAYEMAVCGAKKGISLDPGKVFTKKTFNSGFNSSASLFKNLSIDPKAYLASRAVETDAAKQQEPALCIKGAARGEELVSGGFEFYFAGRMPELFKPILQSVAASYFLAESRFESSLNNTAAAAPVADVNDQHYDMWLNLRTELDPFDLSGGESTKVSMELVLMLAGSSKELDYTMTLEITQQGVIVVEDVLSSSSTSEAVLRCMLNTTGMGTFRAKAGDVDQTGGKQFKLNEQIYVSRKPGTVKPTIHVSLPEFSAINAFDTDLVDVDLGFEFERRWKSADEAEFEANLNFRVEVEGRGYVGSTLPLFVGRQKINPDVLKPGNVSHDTSLLALHEISKGMGQLTFDDIRARQLFPPPKPLPKEFMVYGVRDWVLFHRRRDISCHYERPPVAVVKPRRYRLYYVDSLKSKEDLIALRDALLNDNGSVIARYAPSLAGSVDFDAGLHTVRTSHNSLRINWKALVDDEKAEIMLGAIGSRGEAYDEGMAVAKLRLSNLVDVLAPVTPMDEEGKLFNMPVPPGVLTTDDVDGVIVLATASEAVMCHEVYRLVVANADEFKKVSESIKKDFRGFLSNYEDIKPLAHNVRFKSGEAAFYGDAEVVLKQDWAAAGNSLSTNGVFIYPPSDSGSPTDPEQLLYRDQSTAIANTISGADFIPIIINASEGFQSCVAVDIFVVYSTIGINPG